MTMLLSPVANVVYAASLPTTVFFIPVVTVFPAYEPNNILLLPVVLFFPACQPIAIF